MNVLYILTNLKLQHRKMEILKTKSDTLENKTGQEDIKEMKNNRIMLFMNSSINFRNRKNQGNLQKGV